MNKGVVKEIKLDSSDKEDTLKEISSRDQNNDLTVEEVSDMSRPDTIDVKLPIHTEVQVSESVIPPPVSEIRNSKTENEYLEIENGMRWFSLYSYLNEVSAQTIPSFSVAERSDNEEFNRYTNILPNDSTRVILDGNDSNGYINANYVQIKKAGTKYIMTQGPLEETCGHFWQMVWQVGSLGIVMLNKLYEREREKCHCYYPPIPGNRLQFGDITVTCQSRLEEKDYFISKLRLDCGSESKSRLLTHFQYTIWPDFGAPESSHSFLTFLSVVRETGVLHNSETPAVIHCSAGVGRSGTFILIDSCLRIAEQSDSCDDVNLQEILLDMRTQRFGCIQSKEQLRFSYTCVIQGIKLSKERDEVIRKKEVTRTATKRPLEGSDGDHDEVKKMRN